MITTEKMSVAALLSVNLRRKANRTIDVQWLLDNEEYAYEIFKFTRAQGFDDLTEYANHLEILMFGQVSDTVVRFAKTQTEKAPDETDETTIYDKKNYVGHLR